MKGVVFTEFLEMVEERFSEELADRIVEACDLPSGGAYTTVGTYDHAELVRLVVALGTATGTPVPDLVRAFGRHLFHRFVGMYPQLFVGVRSAFDFLRNIETHIHAEVRKLYPDAELPRLECNEPAPDRMEMIYRSSRPFADLAEGLILGCAEHFGEDLRVTREALAATQGYAVRFTLRRAAEASRWTS
jgi:hypothetical protein